MPHYMFAVHETLQNIMQYSPQLNTVDKDYSVHNFTCSAVKKYGSSSCTALKCRCQSASRSARLHISIMNTGFIKPIDPVWLADSDH